jgi:hypothetical protein
MNEENVLNINFPIDKVFARLKNMNKVKYFPNLVNGVKAAANRVLIEWIDAIKVSKSKEGWKQKYILATRIERSSNPFEATVSSGGMYASLVEKGRKRFDMKDMKYKWLGGPKARKSEDGTLYRIIFMRKGTPTAQKIPPMTSNVYEKAKALNRRLMTGIGDRIVTVGGEGDSSKKYSKADSMNEEDKDGGLVKTGSKGHSQYGTFRVMSKKSKGWIQKAIPASPVFSGVKKKLPPIIKDILSKFFMKDVGAGLEKFVETEGGTK